MLCSGRGGRKEEERRDGQGGVYIVCAARAQVEGQAQAQEGFPDGESEKPFPPWMTATLRRGELLSRHLKLHLHVWTTTKHTWTTLLGLQSLSATAETALVFMAGVCPLVCILLS